MILVAEAEGFEPPGASSAPSIFRIDAINQALPNLQGIREQLKTVVGS